MQYSIEARVARNESDVAHVQSRLENGETALRDLRKLIEKKFAAMEARFERKLEALEASFLRKLERQR